MLKMKNKVCIECENKFQPRQIGQKVCSTACALLWASKHPEVIDKVAKASERARKQRMRKEKREAKEKLMSRSDWLKRAQKAFNSYIRGRDAGQPCISCQTSSRCKVNAGHYRTTAAAPELRFNEDNCHLQCEKCNTYLSGNIGAYRVNLIKKIGIERVEWLEGPHEPIKLSVEQIQAVENKYKAMTKSLLDSR